MGSRGDLLVRIATALLSLAVVGVLMMAAVEMRCCMLLLRVLPLPKAS